MTTPRSSAPAAVGDGEPVAATSDARDAAYLYLATPGDWAEGERLDQAKRILSTEELARYERFRVAAPARSFLAGRALVRRALAHHAGIPAGNWLLRPDEHGRPLIAGPEGAPPVHFNLTHDERLVACLVTTRCDCGVDVESTDRKVDPHRIAEHSFGEEEIEDLRGLEGRALLDRFFAYWTLKEAYLKARGRGIAMRLDSAVFTLGPGTDLAVRFSPAAGDHPGDWQLALFRPARRQRLAVALRRGAGPDLEITAFRALPGQLRSAALDLELLASSRSPGC